MARSLTRNAGNFHRHVTRRLRTATSFAARLAGLVIWGSAAVGMSPANAANAEPTHHAPATNTVAFGPLQKGAQSFGPPEGGTPNSDASAVEQQHRWALSILWEKAAVSGRVSVDRGTLTELNGSADAADQGAFRFPSGQLSRLELSVSPVLNEAHLPALVTVAVFPRAFTFRPDDVFPDFPIYLPEDGVIVTTASDSRPYAEIVASIRSRGRKTQLQRIAAAPEASFASAAATGREVKVETWLALSRDMRVFRIDENLETFQPRFAGYEVKIAETPTQASTYAFQFGRGWNARDTVTRSLDDGELPILRAVVDDDAIQYDVTLFASLETSPLTLETLRGTDFLVADAHGHGATFTPEQRQKVNERRETELNPPEEVVLYVRAVATNRGSAPQYALLNTTS